MNNERRPPYRILFLRSYHNVTESSIILNGLRASTQIEFSQYPPFPQRYRSGIADNIWHELQLHVIESEDAFLQSLSEKRFDLVMLYDKRGVMCAPVQSQPAPMQRVRRWWKSFKNIRTLAKKVPDQPQLPLSLAALCQQLPVAAIDLRDALYLEPGDVEILKQCRLYFKREVPYNRFTLYHRFRKKAYRTEETLAVLNKVHAIPLGILDRTFQELQQKRQTPQDIDIFYGSNTSNTMRITALKRLEKLAEVPGRQIVIARETLPFEDYCQLIARSKITISVEGDGWDCFRHYEAVALGSLPLINRPTMETFWHDRMPDNIFFDNNFSDFELKIQQMLDMEDLRKKTLQKMETAISEHMVWSKIIEYIAETTLNDTESNPK